MRVYIAGPMRGLPGWNFAAFDAAEARWRAAGHQPFSPAQIDRVLQYGPSERGNGIGGSDALGTGGCSREHLRHVISMDIACLMAAEAIALLSGWESSTGSAVELALAQFLGLAVYDAETMQEISPKTRPWSAEPKPAPPLVQDSSGDWGEVWRRSVEVIIAREESLNPRGSHGKEKSCTGI